MNYDRMGLVAQKLTFLYEINIVLRPPLYPPSAAVLFRMPSSYSGQFRPISEVLTQLSRSPSRISVSF